MERLQIAIAKARAARGEAADGTDTPDAPRSDGHSDGRSDGRSDPRPAPPVGPRARPGRTGRTGQADRTEATDGAWNAIPAFDPAPKRLERARITAATGGRAATEFDKLRTRVAQQMSAQGWTRVAVTSPGPNCGKSTVALNLAYAMSRQDASRIMLCEMDLRRPSMARMLGAPPGRDFARVLEAGGEAETFGDHALRLRDNLAVGAVERARAGAAELLHARATAVALDRAQAAYAPTALLIDTPPVLVSDDTIGLIDHVDAVLIVAGAGATTIAEIDACEREVSARAAVLGVVLNKCRHPERGTGYDYYD